MKVVRATVSVEAEDAPAIFGLLAHSSHVDEARVLEMNTSIDGTETLLVAIDGDIDALASSAEDDRAIEFVETVHTGDTTGYVLLVLRPLETPSVEVERRQTGVPGVIALMPLVYRDGTMHARGIGNPAQLQEMLDRGPADMAVTIEEIGEFRGSIDTAWAGLSARQREALEVATGLGYYEQPRGATLADIAAELGCAPQTASDHLQKAEGKVVTAALDEFGPLE